MQEIASLFLRKILQICVIIRLRAWTNSPLPGFILRRAHRKTCLTRSLWIKTGKSIASAPCAESDPRIAPQIFEQVFTEASGPASLRLASPRAGERCPAGAERGRRTRCRSNPSQALRASSPLAHGRGRAKFPSRRFLCKSPEASGDASLRLASPRAGERCPAGAERGRRTRCRSSPSQALSRQLSPRLAAGASHGSSVAPGPASLRLRCF